MSEVEHLHQDAKVLPVKAHCDLITKQFLAASPQPEHQGFKHLQGPPPRREMKQSLLNYKSEVSRKFDSLPASKDSYKKVLKSLHTEAVSATLQAYQPNRVLATQPPEINPEEMKLSRKERTSLARLRSGFSRSLMSYMSRIDPEVLDKCPLCDIFPHNTPHLFNCRANPTELNITDLWTKPI